MNFFVRNALVVFVGAALFYYGIKNIRNQEDELRGVIMAIGICMIPVSILFVAAGITLSIMRLMGTY